MYNKTIILKSRPAGRSAGQSRPVSMLASAGLYASVGRSLCRHRPVSMPAQKKTNMFLKLIVFQHRKDARRMSVPKTVRDNSKSLIWSHSGAKT